MAIIEKEEKTITNQPTDDETERRKSMDNPGKEEKTITNQPTDVEILNQNLVLHKNVGNAKQYFLGKPESRKFFKMKGVDKKTIIKVAEANDALVNASIELTTDKLIEDEDDIEKVITKINTDIGQYITKADKRVTKKTNLHTGEKIDVYGSIVIRNVIKPLIDKELLKECKNKLKEAIQK